MSAEPCELDALDRDDRELRQRSAVVQNLPHVQALRRHLPRASFPSSFAEPDRLDETSELGMCGKRRCEALSGAVWLIEVVGRRLKQNCGVEASLCEWQPVVREK